MTRREKDLLDEFNGRFGHRLEEGFELLADDDVTGKGSALDEGFQIFADDESVYGDVPEE